MALSLSNLLNPVSQEQQLAVEQQKESAEMEAPIADADPVPTPPVQAPTPAPDHEAPPADTPGDDLAPPADIPIKVETIESDVKREVSESPLRESGTASKPKVEKRTKPKHPAPKPKKRKVDEISIRSNTPISVRGKSTPGRKSSTPLSVDNADEEDELYCICRKPDDNRWMIACDGGCEDWFHGACVQMDQIDGDLIDRYICPNCAKAGKGETIWKPMCRLPGCRRPARLAKASPSKYCSDDHGEEFMRLHIASSVPKLAAGGPLQKSELASISKGTLEEFKALGNEIPPVAELEYSSDEQARLDAISRKKNSIHEQRQLLKDREAFLQVSKERAKKGLGDNKRSTAFCGYDPRLSWSMKEVTSWLQDTGIQLDGQSWYAKLVEITPREAPAEGEDVCRKKDCARHHAWAKVQLEDIRFEEVTLAESIGALKEEERAIKDRARLRQAKKDDQREGEVEVIRQ